MQSLEAFRPLLALGDPRDAAGRQNPRQMLREATALIGWPAAPAGSSHG